MPCANMKRMVANPSARWKHAPAWYCLRKTRLPHWRFEAETGAFCSLEWFRNIPFDVVCPRRIDWDNCLCATCINSEMKLDAFANFAKDLSLCWDEGAYDSTDWVIFHIEAVDYPYNEWQRIEVMKTGRVRHCRGKRKSAGKFLSKRSYYNWKGNWSKKCYCWKITLS